MLWKERYSFGIPLIDNQHKELFKRVNALVNAVLSNTPWDIQKQAVNETLIFMQEYVIAHFGEEEKLQKQVQFPDYLYHKKQHDDMVRYVAETIEEFENHGHDQTLIKQFAGKLLAWLINHVATEDVKIANYTHKTEKTKQIGTIALNSVQTIFKAMFNLDCLGEVENNPLKQINTINDSIIISTGVIGDLQGHITLTIPNTSALKLVKILSDIDFDCVDDFVISAVSETANIICGNIITTLTGIKLICDILPPEIIDEYDYDSPEQDSIQIKITSDIGTVTINTDFVIEQSEE